MRIIFVGRVSPEREALSLSEQEFEKEGIHVRLQCHDSQLSVTLSNLQSRKGSLPFAEDCAHQYISSAGFSRAKCFSFEILQAIEEDGESHIFDMRIDEEGLNFEIPEQIFQKVHSGARNDVFLDLSLRDYMKAIDSEIHCASYCYRCIESLMQNFDDWPSFHRELGTSRDAITETIKHFADAQRHGNWLENKTPSRAERNEMLKLTKEIITQYVNFLY